MSNRSYIKFASAKLMHEQGRVPLTAAMDAAGQTPPGALTVYWNLVLGGAAEPVTGAAINGTEYALSGTLPGIVSEEAGRSVVRQFQEIMAGDLIVDLPPNACVTLFPGQVQSGVQPLSGVAPYGPRFGWAGNPGQLYVQAGVGETLGAAWNVAPQGVALSGTLLLRKAT
jgi:hypothetical protein